MPGARYGYEVPIHVVGDRDIALPHVEFARKMLGYVVSQGQDVGKMSRRMSDGTLIVAEVVGRLPRITIDTTQAKKPQRVRTGLDRFVVLAREDGFTGIDPEFPQQWLDAPGVTRPENWLTRFYNSDVAGFSSFTQPKGIYRAFDGVPAFPDGTRFAGNLDHRSKDGYRVSWYGPSARVANDAYVAIGVLYRTKVFMLGEVLLDTAQYEATSGGPSLGLTVVYGAGMVGRKLYVIQGVGLSGVPSAPSVPSDNGFIVHPQQFAGAGDKLYLCRYDLAQHYDGSEIIRFRVVDGSREVLWEENWEGRELQPWFLNPTCTEASSFNAGSAFGARYTVGFVRREEDGMSSDFDFSDQLPDPGGTETPPGASSDLFTLTIPETGDATFLITSSSIAAGNGTSAVLLRDYDADGVRVELEVMRSAVNGKDGTLSFKVGTGIWPLQETIDADTVRRRYLLHADLSQRTLVFAVCDFDYTAPVDGGFTYTTTGGAVRVEVWRNATLVGNIPVSASALATGRVHGAPLAQADRGVTIFEALNSIPLAPSFALYGVLMFSSKNVPIDVEHIQLSAFGGNSAFAYTAYPTALTFGWYRFPHDGTNDQKFGSDRTTLFAYEVDSFSSYIPFACATLGEHTMFSGFPLTPADQQASLSWVGGTTLSQLTGVAGSRKRYHPLWRLGRFDLVVN